MDKIVHRKLSYKITGLLFEAHRKLGSSRNEKQCADKFEELLIREKINYLREFRFKDNKNGLGNTRCICDFIVENIIILEFKTKDYITKEDYVQLKRYLVTLNMQLGILVNFRQQRLAPKRVLNSEFLKYNSNPQINSNTSNVTIPTI